MPPYYVDNTTKQTDGTTALTLALLQQSTINTDVSKRLNYSSSTSAFCVDLLVQNEDLMKSRERIKEGKNKGQDVSEQLKLVKKLTTGKLFKIGTTILGKTLLDIHHENIFKESIRKREKLIKEKKKYDEAVIKANNFFDKNIPFDKLKVKEMHQVLENNWFEELTEYHQEIITGCCK